MTCLALAGSILAGAHYFAIDLPRQQSAPAPHNYSPAGSCENCPSWCTAIISYAIVKDYEGCMKNCLETC